MVRCITNQTVEQPLSVSQTEFAARVIPAVERPARFYVRQIKCPDRRADLIAEAVGLAWKWFGRLADRGKDGTQFTPAIASYAARSANSGRRVCFPEVSEDMRAPVA